MPFNILSILLLFHISLLSITLSLPMSTSHSKTRPKTITFIRHGRTYANEYLSKTHRWGSPTFTDSWSLLDSPLNPTGIDQATSLKETLGSEIQVDPESTIVLVSPLTRTLETFRLSGSGGIYEGCDVKACKVRRREALTSKGLTSVYRFGFFSYEQSLPASG